MSEDFDIEKFSENAQKMTETLEKSSQYVNDIDRAMTRLHETVNNTDIFAKLDSYDQRLQEVQESSRKIVETLADRPQELQETARRMLESTEQFGNSYNYLESFTERAEKLTELMQTLGSLSILEERLTKYQEDLSKASDMIAQIRKQEMEIRNLPDVLKAMKESVTDLQKQYMEAAADLRDQGNEALDGVRSVKESVAKAEDLQRALSEQVGFFKIGIYVLIVMNTLMMVFVAIFLIKELFF